MMSAFLGENKFILIRTNKMTNLENDKWELLDFRTSPKICQAVATFQKHFSDSAYFVIAMSIQGQCDTMKEAEKMARILAKRTILISPLYGEKSVRRMGTSKLHLIFS